MTSWAFKPWRGAFFWVGFLAAGVMCSSGPGPSNHFWLTWRVVHSFWMKPIINCVTCAPILTCVNCQLSMVLAKFQHETIRNLHGWKDFSLCTGFAALEMPQWASYIFMRDFRRCTALSWVVTERLNCKMKARSAVQTPAKQSLYFALMSQSILSNRSVKAMHASVGPRLHALLHLSIRGGNGDGCLRSFCCFRTVRIYTGTDFGHVQVLDHESPVQCLLVLENRDILTGANDSAIKWWSNGQLKGRFNGHTDTVRWKFLCSLLPSHTRLTAMLNYKQPPSCHTHLEVCQSKI